MFELLRNEVVLASWGLNSQIKYIHKNQTRRFINTFQTKIDLIYTSSIKTWPFFTLQFTITHAHTPISTILHPICSPHIHTRIHSSINVTKLGRVTVLTPECLRNCLNQSTNHMIHTNSPKYKLRATCHLIHLLAYTRHWFDFLGGF